MLRLLLLGRWLNDRNKHSTLLQRFSRALLRITTLSVEHDVDIARHIFEFGCCIVDGLVDTQLRKKRLIASRSCPDDMCAPGLRELRGKDSEASSCAMDQEFLASLRV